MKKLFLMAVMAMITLAANAQQGEYFVTPRVGLGYTHNSGFGEFCNGFGVSLGAEYEYMVSDKVGLSAGVDFLYSQSDRVEESTPAEHYNSGESYTEFSFLNIPLIVQLHAGQFAFKAGLQPTINTSATLHVDGVKIGTDNLRKVGLALPFGVSYQFRSPLVLDLRCALPITKLNKEDNLDGDPDNKFTSVMLTLGWKF
ncbi:MAG: outer membrane beta-barrel protein [Bacteroidales bacterium]|nr:outer membrane beta-barrel protein [Bacteroidales bacterium]